MPSAEVFYTQKCPKNALSGQKSNVFNIVAKPNERSEGDVSVNFCCVPPKLGAISAHIFVWGLSTLPLSHLWT